MLYTIQRLPDQPIYLVTVKPPLHPRKFIYGIDTELLRLHATHRGPLYRVDNLTALEPHHFTRSDALEWWSGPVREDLAWRGNVVHVAACRPGIARLVQSVYACGERLLVPLFPDLASAITDAHAAYVRQSRH